MTTTAPHPHNVTVAHHEHSHTDPHDVELHRPQASWALLVVALVAQILVVLDISVVNTALPSIGAGLEAAQR